MPKPKTGFSACAASQTRQVSSIATEKSPVESREHQDNANIHCQSFPEVVSKKREIHTDYDGYHHHHVNHYSYLSARFSHAGADSSVLQTFGDPAPRGKLKIPWEISREGSSLSVRTKIFSVVLDQLYSGPKSTNHKSLRCWPPNQSLAADCLL
ncbi:MAG: hypothetical protein WCB22_20995 [Pseudolabrys sp.]